MELADITAIEDNLRHVHNVPVSLQKLANQVARQYSNFILTNVTVDGNPIVYVSHGFSELTGYNWNDLSGRSGNCNFLFGTDTRYEHITRIHNAVRLKQSLRNGVILYKKNREAFIGNVEIEPIKKESGVPGMLVVSVKLVADLEKERIEALLPSYRNKGMKRLTRKKKTVSLPKLDTETANMDNNSMEAHRELTSSLVMKELTGGKKPWVINHTNTFRIIWDWLTMVATFYVGVVTPYNAVFATEDMYYQTENLFCDVIIEIVFVTDLVMNFRTTYYDGAGQLVRDPKRIARRYLTSWFIVDFLAAIPYDALYLIDGSNRTILLIKCVRLLRLARLFSSLERYSQYSSIILTINMTLYVLLAHWFACIWFLIGREEYENDEQDWNVGWLYRLNRFLTNSNSENKPAYALSLPMNYFTALYFSMTLLTTVGSVLLLIAGWMYQLDRQLTGLFVVNKPSKTKQITQTVLTFSQEYWTSLYFALTMLTTVGFGNIDANTVQEKIAVCVAMPLFALMHAVVFGNVTAIIQRMYARRFSYDIQVNELQDFYRIYNVPKPLKKKIQEFYQNVWTVHRGINHEKIVQDFPEDLKADVCKHIYSDILSRPMFHDAPRGCLKMLSLKIKHSFVHPGDYLLHTGDIPQQIYYVCNGSLEIWQNDKLTGLIGKGELFGCEVSVLTVPRIKSAVDVKAVTYCDLHYINAAYLLDALTLYPEFGIHFLRRLPQELAVTINTEADRDPMEDTSVGGASPSSMLLRLSNDTLHVPTYPSRASSPDAGLSADINILKQQQSVILECLRKLMKENEDVATDKVHIINIK